MTEFIAQEESATNRVLQHIKVAGSVKIHCLRADDVGDIRLLMGG